MIKRNISEEISSLFKYIRDVICTEHPNVIINEYTYILAVLHNEDSLAYQALSSIVMESTLEEMRKFFEHQITYAADTEDDGDKSPYSLFDEYIVDCDDMCKQFGIQNITSSILLLSIVKKHESISSQMRYFSITLAQLLNSIKSQLTELTTALVETPKKHKNKRKNEILEISHPIKVIDNSVQRNSEIERSLINISRLASLGKIQNVINYDKYYSEIFTILSKKNRNNVAICGKSGVGKTAIAKNIANIINEKKCHVNFHDKTLMEMDFSKLVVGTPFKGAFEQKFYAIVEEARTRGNYIFFIDNIHFLLNSNTKYAETDIETLLEVLFTDPSIQIVCTTTPASYSKLQKKSLLGKYLQEVTIEEPTIEECVDILHKIKSQYEAYHDVVYDDLAITSCVELSKKYIRNRSLPESALDLLDIVGAKTNMQSEDNPKLMALKEELSDIIDEIDTIKSSSATKQYDKIDELVKKQISVKTKIGLIEKEDILSKEPTHITKNDVCVLLSEKIDIPLEDLTSSEKVRLKGLNDKIKENVIGQDEAVDEVCRAIKRQRVGLGENERPSVLMFLGSTGTGKTYLAKQIAKEVFGDEKYFVRMDMSEYADKTSVNKIGGSNPGYVGYEDETYIVKALKKKKRFVLLLDEFEKSNEEVHNIFLQMFDEGRFTDNHGEEYSLKDVIIIMTSNVGVAEAASRGHIIGFNDNDYDFSKSIIEKELKRKFKPEFLNRIQKIVYFNKLNNENLKSIVELEVAKLNRKVEKLGYHLSENILKTTMIDEIYNEILSKKEFGARPIVNEVQRKIEDNIVDYLIENEVEEGHTFTYEELMSLDL